MCIPLRHRNVSRIAMHAPSYRYPDHQKRLQKCTLKQVHTELFRFVTAIWEAEYLIRLPELQHQSNHFTAYKSQCLLFYESKCMCFFSWKKYRWNHKVICCSLLSVIKFTATNHILHMLISFTFVQFVFVYFYRKNHMIIKELPWSPCVLCAFQ